MEANLALARRSLEQAEATHSRVLALEAKEGAEAAQARLGASASLDSLAAEKAAEKAAETAAEKLTMFTKTRGEARLARAKAGIGVQQTQPKSLSAKQASEYRSQIRVMQAALELYSEHDAATPFSQGSAVLPIILRALAQLHKLMGHGMEAALCVGEANSLERARAARSLQAQSEGASTAQSKGAPPLQARVWVCS